MRPTRRTTTSGLICLLFAVGGVLLSYPVLVVGAALIFGWLLTQQLIAVRQFQVTQEYTAVTLSPAVDTTRIDADIPVTIDAQRPAAAAETQLTLTVRLPPAADAVDQTDRTVVLHPGETDASDTIVTSVPTAGRMTVPEPVWHIRDSHGLFTESFIQGPSPAIVVEAPDSNNIHMGRGGSELAAYGRHPTDETGEGITPAELREYTGVEPADKIDWKATARLPDTYIREFEAESDRDVSLLVDHRSHTATGTQVDEPLRYLRAVALGVIETAESDGDPIGLLTVGNNGLTTIMSPTRQQDRIAEIKERLYTLDPTPAGSPDSAVDLRHPKVVRQLSRQLSDDNSAFATTLRAFTDSATGYLQYMESDPLYSGVEYLNTTTQMTQLRVILTTDQQKSRLRETVRTAATGDNSVIVFIAPSVLFDSGSLADIETAYTQYREFEEFRAALDRYDSVAAYEIGPRDRLTALLSAQKQKPRSQSNSNKS